MSYDIDTKEGMNNAVKWTQAMLLSMMAVCGWCRVQ